MEKKLVKIILLKSGKWAMHPSLGPVVCMHEGHTMLLDEVDANRLIDSGWAEIYKNPFTVPGEPVSSEPLTVDPPEEVSESPKIKTKFRIKKPGKRKKKT